MKVGDGRSSLDVGELLRAVDAGEPLLLLDVRNTEDFASWRIEGRRPVETVHAPYFDFLEDPEGAAARVPAGRSIVAVCTRGASSAMVAETLRERGRTAWNLEGGMVAYGNHLEAVPVPVPPGAASAFEIWQIQRRGRGCLAYVVCAGGEAVVVDPSRHVGFFEDFVRGLGVRLVRVVDTHLHADHLSGGAELARRTGVAYAVGAAGGPAPGDAHVLGQGESLWPAETGSPPVATLVLQTPGHTPGSCSILVGGTCLLSGDTLLVRGIGRPDLGGDSRAWGRALFQTLRGRLAALGDDTLVLPAHSGGPDEADATGLVATRMRAVRRAPEFRISSEAQFLDAITTGGSGAPASYAAMVRANAAATGVDETQAEEWELGPNRCAVNADAPVR